MLTASQAGIPNSLRYSQKTDFAPRVGFAWRVTSDGKTVIRGGYGKFIDSPLGFLILSSWAVEASDVATFTNSVKGGKAQYTFPYPFPPTLLSLARRISICRTTYITRTPTSSNGTSPSSVTSASKLVYAFLTTAATVPTCLSPTLIRSLRTRSTLPRPARARRTRCWIRS